MLKLDMREQKGVTQLSGKRSDVKKMYKKRRQLLIFLLVAMFFIVSGTTFKIFMVLKNTALATSSKETFSTEGFNLIGSNNPINLALNDEIRLINEEKAKAKVEAEREAIKASNKETDKNRKVAYLTFDDGPSKNVTPMVLDILSEYNIKATFFVVGKMVNVNPEVLKRVQDEGHAIGHHSYSHDYKYIYKNTTNFINELNKTDRTFKDALGEEFESKLLRFPGGSFEAKKQKFVKATAKLGYSSYDWNALNGDAEGHLLPKRTLVNRLKASSKGKKEIIVLMHDTDAKKTTAESLAEVIEYLISEGYEFRTLNEY